MMPWRQARRRLNPRINEEDAWVAFARTLRSEGVFKSIVIAIAFATIASVILMLRSDVVAYRPGQYVSHDINARTEFRYFDGDRFEEVKSKAAVAQPRVFKESRRVWDEIQQALLALPDRVKGQKLEDLKDVELASVLDNATLGRLQEIAEQASRANWETSVKNFVASLRKLDLIVLDESVRSDQIATGRMIHVVGIGERYPQYTYAPSMGEAISHRIEGAARENFQAGLWSKIAFFAKLNLVGAPTHEIDQLATQQAENAAKAAVTRDQGIKLYAANQTIVPAGPIDESDWQILREESRAYRQSLGTRASVLEYAGLVGSVCLITVALCVYITKYARRIVKNHARAVGIAALLLSTLLIAQLTAIGTNRLYFSGVAPTILCAMILSVAYDQRFALGIAALHAALVTIAVGQGLPFYLVLLAGSSMCCLTIDDLRSRSRLIEVGGFTAVAIMLTTCAMGLLNGDPFEFVMTDSLFGGAAGITVGFVVLGILPFIERAFRITTSMTLLELADTGHPLLRKLAQEAPGTYNHSMQVANLSEEAVAAIGGKALLARVGAYYHDVGKMNKPEYFIENQSQGAPNRHMTLNPNVSMLIITGHVKDGIELAREHNLPTALFPFIQSHHGTTLVEYFYWRAVKQEEARIGEEADVPEHQYRYPGPKPRSKEVGIVMLADAVESICRTLDEPTASRIEGIVNEVIDKRLKDGQFDDCEITMREIHLVEKSLIRTLLGIYHARIAYPTDARADVDASPTTEIKSA
jgi:putative nucleotidyltransferase with HDIG domain